MCYERDTGAPLKVMFERGILCFNRSLKYCDLRMISCSYLQRTTLEQELGLAAYLVKADSRPPQNPGPGSDLLESDTEKLSSTDNEEEEGQEHSKTICTSGCLTDWLHHIWSYYLFCHDILPCCSHP